MPISENASTLQHIEMYGFRRMTFLQVFRLGIHCRKGKRRYLVPREHIIDDTPPSYLSGIESNRARSSVEARQMSQRAQLTSPVRSLEACHAPVRSPSSNRHQDISEPPNTSFDAFDMDLKDLVDLFVSRASMVRLFFTGARGPSAATVPRLAEDLERLAASVDKLRPKFQRVATRECGSSRFELLDYGESLSASLKRWIDKTKPMFDDFKVVMFGDEQGNFVQVTDGDYEAWAREAREIGNWTQILINRVGGAADDFVRELATSSKYLSFCGLRDELIRRANHSTHIERDFRRDGEDFTAREKREGAESTAVGQSSCISQHSNDVLLGPRSFLLLVDRD